ncbi:DUF6596 domain-containing protein [Streptosporangium subroseum]|uniref:DUF6596 domain-containing protein n=1 Tax=Streptosporangium subroseum TaxID=106412 RepID=UPI003B8351E9
MSREGQVRFRESRRVTVIRLTRLLHRLLPSEAEVAGLLALMLPTDAHQEARTDTDATHTSRRPATPSVGQDRDRRRPGHSRQYLPP